MQLNSDPLYQKSLVAGLFLVKLFQNTCQYRAVSGFLRHGVFLSRLVLFTVFVLKCC